MPPQKRKRSTRNSTATVTGADNSAIANTTLSSLTTTTTTSHDPTDATTLLNATFTTHRASPLYLGGPDTPLTQARLHVLSQRLRDLLIGDVVRGIELTNAEDGLLRQTGALEAVSWGWVRLEELLGRNVSGDEDAADTSLESAADSLGGGGGSGGGAGAGGSPGKRRALQLSLQYERGEYAALLLPSLGSEAHIGMPDVEGADGFAMRQGLDDDATFVHLPLLLLRMPAPLKAVICGFISRTFDCCISALGLGTRSLVGALECWLGESTALAPPLGQGAGMMAKDVMVTFGFYAPSVLRSKESSSANMRSGGGADDDDGDGAKVSTMGIKAIDVTIPTAELHRFVKVGQAREQAKGATDSPGCSSTRRRRLGGDKDEEGWSWRFHEDDENDAQQPQPFTSALAAYLRRHLALDMFHPAVRVTRVACGGFLLSEGRVKLFGVPPAAEGEECDGAGRSALGDGLQRAVWAVFGGLVERARVRPVVRTLDVVMGDT
ncbi:unnamed protein product [Discula destructiva]